MSAVRFTNLFSDPEINSPADTSSYKGPLAWLISTAAAAAKSQEAYRSIGGALPCDPHHRAQARELRATAPTPSPRHKLSGHALLASVHEAAVADRKAECVE